MATPLSVLTSTWALWHFDEVAGVSVADSGPNGINLTLDPSSDFSVPVVSSFLTRARSFAAQGLYSKSAPGALIPGSAGDLAMWQGEWTVEALFTPSGAQPIGAYGAILAYGGPTLVATQNHQAAFLIKRNGAGNNTISILWANGIGNLVVVDSIAQFDDTIHLLTVVKRLPGGGTAALDFYVDDVLKQTVTGIALPSGGSGAGWVIGANFPSDGAPNPAIANLYGVLDELRVSSAPFIASAVAADFYSIFGATPPGFGTGGGVGAGLTPPPTPASYNSDHLGVALNRLIQQYKNRPNIAKLLTAVMGEVQLIENVLNDIRWVRALNLATGQQLDRLGKLLGLPRDGRQDASYRNWLRAQVILLISSGTPEDIYAIFSALMAGLAAVFQNVEYFPASFALRLGGVAVPTPDDFAAILQRAKGAGIRAVLEYNTDTDANTFTMEPNAAFLSAGTIVGVTSLPVYSTAGFPPAGSVILDKGLATEETLAYTAITPTAFTVPATTKAHVQNATVQLTTSVGKGMGDTGNAATGGAMAGAQ